MIDKKAMAEVRVLAFDGHRGNLETTRSLLSAVGCRQMEGHVELSDFTRRLESPLFDLLLLDGTDCAPAGSDLIQRLRRGDVGQNPFVPILVTSWDGRGAPVSEFLNAGADDVLLLSLIHISQTVYVSDLLETAGHLSRTARRTGVSDLKEISDVMERAVVQAVTPTRDQRDGAALVRDLALAFHLAYAGGDNALFRAELEDVLEKVRARLDKVRDPSARKNWMLGAA